MRRPVLAFALRGGAAWTAREDRALTAAVRFYALDADDARTSERARRRRFVKWRDVSRALGRSERAVRSRWLVLRLARRLCGCKRRRRA